MNTVASELSQFRQARIQHNILSAMEGGLISKAYAIQKLCSRLCFSATRAQRVVDGEDD